MIVCATSNAFLRQVRTGSFKLLEQAAARQWCEYKNLESE